MSLGEKRQALADALSTVDGITGYPKRPNVITVGTAWPLFQGKEPDDDQRIAFRHNWAIAVVVGDDELSADAFIDDGRDEDVADALQSLLYVTAIRPSTLPTDVGLMYALTITGESE